MNSDIQIFKNKEFGDIRTVMDEQTNEPLFCGVDVCNALGYEKPRNAIATHVDEPDALKQGVRSGGQMRQMTFVNESGLYSLIFSSQLPTAKKFKRWVTSEVLPSIRKTGKYAMGGEREYAGGDLPRGLLEFAEALVKEHRRRNNAEHRLTVTEETLRHQTYYIQQLEQQLGIEPCLTDNAKCELTSGDTEWIGAKMIAYLNKFFSREGVYGTPQDLDSMMTECAKDGHKERVARRFKKKLLYYCEKNGILVNPQQLFKNKVGKTLKKASVTNYFAHQTWRHKIFAREDGTTYEQYVLERTEHGLYFYRKGVDRVPKDNNQLMEAYYDFLDRQKMTDEQKEQ